MVFVACVHGWVMSHIWMTLARIELWRTCEWLSLACDFEHVNDFGCVCAWVMSCIGMNYVAHMNDSRSYRVMPHLWMTLARILVCLRESCLQESKRTGEPGWERDPGTESEEESESESNSESESKSASHTLWLCAYACTPSLSPHPPPFPCFALVFPYFSLSVSLCRFLWLRLATKLNNQKQNKFTRACTYAHAQTRTLTRTHTHTYRRAGCLIRVGNVTHSYVQHASFICVCRSYMCGIIGTT